MTWLISLLLTIQANAGDPACSESGRYLEVVTSTSTLHLCENAHEAGAFKVSLGRGGLGKKRQGDGQTPIGNYPLGIPRPSHRFSTFIPIGYPTKEQTAQGLTGSDVGVHGPMRFLSWLGGLNTWFNWTNGCIAVGSNEEITQIADWVRANRVDRITIR